MTIKERWNRPASEVNPIILEIANQAVPETGVIAKVRNDKITKDETAPTCSDETILSAGRNFCLETTGPPKKDSIKLGTCISGTVSYTHLTLPTIVCG